jgi:hypothetical protein
LIGQPTTTVEIWYADLDALVVHRGRRLGSYLSKDERERASRYSTWPRASRYAAAREMLRAILAARIDQHPADIVLAHGPHGKPSTKIGPNFSVAHCGRLSVVAVTQLDAIGIDIERIRQDLDVDRVARRIFEAEEMCRLVALPDGEGVRALFDRWVQTEAIIKLRGTGLLPFWASRPGPPTVASEADTDDAYTLTMFSPSRGVTGCIAIRGRRSVVLQLRTMIELDMIERDDRASLVG